MIKKLVLSVFLCFILFFSVLPVYALTSDEAAVFIYDSVFFFEIGDDEVRARVLASAERLNIENFEDALITVCEAAVSFITPMSAYDISRMDGILWPEYGLTSDELCRQASSRPDTVSPYGYRWSFSGSSLAGSPLWTQHYVTGRTSYAVTGTVGYDSRALTVTVDVRRRNRFLIFNTSTLIVGRTVGRGENISIDADANSEYAVYLRFSSNNGFRVNGNITGQ